MINETQLELRKLDLEGVNTLVKWAEAEGWNPGPYDASAYFAADPDGFYGYLYNDEMIGGGSIVSYSREFGFMGFFIMKPEYRSQGLGRKLWYRRRDKLLSRLNHGASIGMDGVIAMQPFYKEGGFRIAFRDVRYEKAGIDFKTDRNISAIKDRDIEPIIEYDKKCFGFARPAFMRPWLKLPGIKTFKYTENGRLAGFAIVRKAGKGYKVCPLFADTETIAEELYKACLNSVPGESLYLDIPVINTGAVNIIKKYSCTYVFECARMYYGPPPEVDIDKIFGITTFELG